jgi:hypothetical protein
MFSKPIPNAKTNTRILTVTGNIYDGTTIIRNVPITVRFTSDEMRETLSLSNADTQVMFTVNFGQVAELIHETRLCSHQ